LNSSTGRTGGLIDGSGFVQASTGIVHYEGINNPMKIKPFIEYIREEADPFAHLARLIELGVGPEDTDATALLARALGDRYDQDDRYGVDDIWWNPSAGRGEVVLQVDFRGGRNCKLQYAGNDRFMWIANFGGDRIVKKEFLVVTNPYELNSATRGVELARALWWPSIKFLDEWIAGQRRSLGESSDLGRLYDLGLADPVDAALAHLVKISQGTDWPLTQLDDTGEEDEDSGERYFVPIGPGFGDGADGYDGGVDWSVFTVGIEPDGGVNFHYDAGPQTLDRHHSEEASQFMSQSLVPVPIPFGRISSADWDDLCSNIAENNDWS